MSHFKKEVIIHEIPTLNLNKYTPFFEKEELLKQLFLGEYMLLKAYGVNLNLKQDQVSDKPCGICDGTDFIRTGTCHVCIICGEGQGCS